MINSEGIEMRGYRFAVQRPSGRLSARWFGSSFRAAEHAMTAYSVLHWSVLRDRGFRVVRVA